jgi:hypothetical protein
VPNDHALALRCGRALKRSGRAIEALTMFRRPLGENTSVAAIDPRTQVVRVAFIVQYAPGWSSLESVWQALREDPQFSVIVIACPFQHENAIEGGADSIYGFLESRGVAFTRWENFPLKPGFADVVFVQSPYDNTRPEPLRTPALLKLVPRLAYVPYGLEIGGGETNASHQFNLPLQQMAWAVFARSPRHKAMFAKHCATGDTHVEITGHPRMDAIRALSSLPADDEFTAFACGRKIVFWNPQFDVRPDGTGYSTFMVWQQFLLEAFAQRQELAFVIRPHPLFFGTLESRGVWSATQVSEFLGRVERAGNILIDRRASYLPIFAASAAMISDASTFLIEYLGTGKPLCYLHNAKGPQLNSDGEFIRAHIATAERENDITSFLDNIETCLDGQAAQRMTRYAEVMHQPPEGVAAAIKRALLTRLASEAAQMAPAAAA